jgi:hypothetical protein
MQQRLSSVPGDRAWRIIESEQVPPTMTSRIPKPPSDSEHRVQDDPYIGAPTLSFDVAVDDRAVEMYVNAVDDQTFWGFQSRVVATSGERIAPLLVLDRDLTARSVGGPGKGHGFHSGQTFRFLEPIEIGLVYAIRGEVTDVFEKRGVGYFTTRTTATPIDQPDRVFQESLYTRAFRFPENRYPAPQTGFKLSFSEWLDSNGYVDGLAFPAPGAIVEGRTSFIDQARMALYSDQEAALHSDPVLSRRRGLPDIIGQALMATELEAELYRDMFGLSLFRRGTIEAKYIDQIPNDTKWRAAAIVQSVTDDEIVLKSAVASSAGQVVTIATVTVRDWKHD